MDSQSSNANEVPAEITCNQDEQFFEEITSVKALLCKSKLLTSSDGDSDRDEISYGYDDCTGAICDIPLEHRSVDVDENDFVKGFWNKTCQCSKLYGSPSAKLNFDQMLDYRQQCTPRQGSGTPLLQNTEKMSVLW